MWPCLTVGVLSPAVCVKEVRKLTKQIPAEVQTGYLVVTRLQLVVTESVLPAFELRYVQMNFRFNLMFSWPCIMNWFYIDYQLDASIIIYSWNNILLYMFRASSAHLQEDTVVHVQHMVLSLSMRVPGVLRHPPTTFPLQSVLTQAVYRQATKNSHREWQYHMLHVYNCILLKMSTWGSKHVEENIILWINNNQYIKLVINI